MIKRHDKYIKKNFPKILYVVIFQQIIHYEFLRPNFEAKI